MIQVVHSWFNEVLLLRTPRRLYKDARGAFEVVENLSELQAVVGHRLSFEQINRSYSKENVVRGLHYQTSIYAQGKLVKVVNGKIRDIFVNISATEDAGKFGVIDIDADPELSLWVPPGYAHGFQTLDSNTIVEYKVTAPYAPQYEKCLHWQDKVVGDWTHDFGYPQRLSAKDLEGHPFSETSFY